ncbi:MAG: Ig-like domain-containing protein [Fimbriiglobus sp.]
MATITNSTISNNSASNAGGIHTQTREMNISNTTILGNTASSQGGILVSGPANLTNVTIFGNKGSSGGGINTTPGFLNLKNSIVAGNFDGSTPSDIFSEVLASSQNNLIGVDTNLVGISNGSNGNQIGTAGTPLDAKLGAFALNGGLTKTLALLPGSPALNKGDNAGLATTDQRGLVRVVGTADIGAYELQAVAITPAVMSTATLGASYSQPISASFLNQPTGTTYSFVSTGTLPPGLSLSPAGIVSGTPTAAGTTVFTVTATASTGDFSSTDVSLLVNTLPIAKNDSARTSQNRAVTVAVLANDSDADGQTLRVISTAAPSKGSLVVNGDQTISYTPNTDFVGNDSFSYTVDDGVGGRATATVTVPVTAELAKEFAVGQDVGGSDVNFYNPDGSLRFTVTPFPSFSGGVRTAAADFNRDGVADIVIGTGPGRSTRVVILDGKNQATLFTVDPFEEAFRGGVFVSVGDVTGDGLPDLAITPDEGGGPRVDVYSGAEGFPKLNAFLGIDDSAFRGGARSSIADMDGDGFGDLIVVAGFGGGPRVASFNGKSLTGTPQRLFGDFFAFEQTLRNGVFVTAGDLNGDGKADLIAGGGPGGGPRVLALDGAKLIDNQQTTLANFFSGDVNSRGGIRLAVKDLDGDNLVDLLVGSGTKAGSKATTFLGKNITANGTPVTNLDFDAFAGFTGGIFVG